MYQQTDPLPGCGFVIHSSPPHYSPNHHLHNDPLVASEHHIKPVGSDGRIGKSIGSFHTPFYGQTTLGMFGIK